MPDSRPQRSLSFGPEFAPSEYTKEIVHGTLDCISALEEQLQDLVEVRCVPDRYRTQTPSNHKSALDLLSSLGSYPDHMREVVKGRCGDFPDEDTLIMFLQHDARIVLSCSRSLTEWFDAPGINRIPVAIQREVDAAFLRHGLKNVVTLITAGPPEAIDIRIEDVRSSFRLYHEPKEHHETLHTVLRIPHRAANSPHRWSIVLGHEVGHHRLRAENAAWLASQREEGFHLPENAPKTALKDDIPVDGTLLLWQVGLFHAFPFVDVGEDIKKQTLAKRPTGSLQPVEKDDGGKRGGLDGGHPSAAAVDNAVIRRVRVANDWLTEIVCDLIMVRSYGPAAVVAMADHLIMTNNMRPVTDTHPPGALRLKLMREYLTRSDLGVLSQLLAPLKAPSFESEAAKTDPAAARVIDYLESHASNVYEFVDRLDLPTYEVGDPARQRAVVCSVNQLAWGVPPHAADFDAFSDSGIELGLPPSSELVNPTAEDLLNASCLALALQATRQIEARIPVDRLTLKAIETIQTLDMAERGTDEAPFEPLQLPRPSEVEAEAGFGRAILSADDIRRRFVAARTSERIVMSPMTLEKEMKNPSIDLRLGTRFITFHRSSIASFDAVSNDRPRAVQREHEVSMEQPFVLHPGEVVLASALEYIALPYNVAAQVITRSSYGRLGLITATAVQVHPYYRGCLTLELVNLGNVPLALYPGEQVAQLIFFAVGNGDASAPTNPGPEIVRGSFVCPTGPEFPDVRLEKDPWLRRLRAGQQVRTG